MKEDQNTEGIRPLYIREEGIYEFLKETKAMHPRRDAIGRQGSILDRIMYLKNDPELFPGRKVIFFLKEYTLHNSLEIDTQQVYQVNAYDDACVELVWQRIDLIPSPKNEAK